MKVKAVVDEDFANYKEPAMFIGAVSCGGKCCIEAGLPLSVCQNDGWRESAPIEVSTKELIERYLKEPLTEAIVFGGLEPFEQFEDVCDFIRTLRDDYKCSDDVVIYTGYNYDEIADEVERLKRYPNIVVKFGRYVPNHSARDDEVLGVTLASDNQYAERIS